MHQVVGRISGRARVHRASGRTGNFLISLLAVLVSALLLSWPAASVAQSWQYVYDEVGRLKAAIAPNGDRADYEYDAVGNIVAIRRSGVGALNISEFTPQIGKGGTSVKITGSGFSTNLASNVVKFNGAAATVTAATATQLTVTAPTAGSTGPINVNVGAATVTSRDSFVYSSTSVTGAPTIATITPNCAVPGTTVAMIAPTLMWHRAPPESSLAMLLRARRSRRQLRCRSWFRSERRHPPGWSQRSACRAQRRSSLCLRPEPALTTRRRCGQCSTVRRQQSTSRWQARRRLCCSLGMQAPPLAFSSDRSPSVPGATLTYVVYSTSNSVLTTGSVSPTASSLHLPVLPVTGTYAIVLYWNDGTATGTASFQLQSNPTLSTSGSDLAVTFGSGQSVRAQFAGTAGRDLTGMCPRWH